MTITTTDTALSADDITALRMADSITFHHGPPNARYVATCVRAHLSGGYSDEPRIWTAREQRLFPSGDTGGGRDRLREVLPERSTVTGYDWTAGTFPDAQAFHMMHYVTPEWATIVSLLRAGDTLRVSWSADNNNENHKGVGFHQDELRLSVHRGARVMNFLITKSVGPNNSARMIRREGL